MVSLSALAHYVGWACHLVIKTPRPTTLLENGLTRGDKQVWSQACVSLISVKPIMAGGFYGA
jgi:hypothetical protein